MASAMYLECAGQGAGAVGFPATRGVFRVGGFQGLSRIRLSTDAIGGAILTITGLLSGSDVVIYDPTIPATGDGTNVIQTFDSIVGTYLEYSYLYGLIPKSINVGVFKSGYKPTYIRNYILSIYNSSLPISQPLDPSYA